MKKIITRKHGVVALAIALANFNITAQDDGGEATTELNPLNVVGSQADAPALSSGLKSSGLVKDIPKSISVVTDDQIKAQGLKSVGDIIDYTPGVNNSQGEGHRDAAVIRGMRTTQDFYRDGIRDDVQYYRPLYNIEQVEIIRGPDALLSGFGGAYGLINRVSKKGLIGEDFTVVSGSIDTFGEHNVQLDKNMQLNDKTALRVNIFGENLENHRDFYYGDGFGLNPTLKYDLGDGSTLDISYEYLDQERFIDRGIPTGADKKPVKALKDIVFGDPSENFSPHTKHIYFVQSSNIKQLITSLVSFRQVIATMINYMQTSMLLATVQRITPQLWMDMLTQLNAQHPSFLMIYLENFKLAVSLIALQLELNISIQITIMIVTMRIGYPITTKILILKYFQLLVL